MERSPLQFSVFHGFCDDIGSLFQKGDVRADIIGPQQAAVFLKYNGKADHIRKTIILDLIFPYIPEGQFKHRMPVLRNSTPMMWPSCRPLLSSSKTCTSASVRMGCHWCSFMVCHLPFLKFLSLKSIIAQKKLFSREKETDAFLYGQNKKPNTFRCWALASLVEMNLRNTIEGRTERKSLCNGMYF